MYMPWNGGPNLKVTKFQNRWHWYVWVEVGGSPRYGFKGTSKIWKLYISQQKRGSLNGTGKHDFIVVMNIHLTFIRIKIVVIWCFWLKLYIRWEYRPWCFNIIQESNHLWLSILFEMIIKLTKKSDDLNLFKVLVPIHSLTPLTPIL